METLDEAGLVRRGETELVGASGGGLITALYTMGVRMDDVVEAQRDMYAALIRDDKLEVRTPPPRRPDSGAPPNGSGWIWMDRWVV